MSTLKALKALVVDDRIDSCDLVRFILEAQEMDVACATSVNEALEIYKSFQPDILIADITMPLVDGYELIRQIRMLSPEEGGQVPAIAVTAHVTGNAKLQAMKAGYQAFITKPLDMDELIAAVTELLTLIPKPFCNLPSRSTETQATA